MAVSSMPPAQFRCQLNGQRKSRHLTGPGRTLVYIQRTSSARAVSPPTQRLPIQGPYSDLLIRCVGPGAQVDPTKGESHKLPTTGCANDILYEYLVRYKYKNSYTVLIVDIVGTCATCCRRCRLLSGGALPLRTKKSEFGYSERAHRSDN